MARITRLATTLYLVLAVFLMASLVIGSVWLPRQPIDGGVEMSYIVQSLSASAAAQAVRQAGGSVVHQLHSTVWRRR